MGSKPGIGRKQGTSRSSLLSFFNLEQPLMPSPDTTAEYDYTTPVSMRINKRQRGVRLYQSSPPVMTHEVCLYYCPCAA